MNSGTDYIEQENSSERFIQWICIFKTSTIIKLNEKVNNTSFCKHIIEVSSNQDFCETVRPIEFPFLLEK